MQRNESETRFAVLLFSDIVGSTDLKARHGVPAYSAALRVHNDHFERSVRECRGIRILQNMGDGYFAEAGSVSEAVRFALLFQDAMRAGPWGEVCLTTRVGIHAGEVTALVAEGGSGIVAPAADLAARVMSLAVGGQILLTRFPFDETRHFVREHPNVTGKDAPPLRWLAHGPYLLKGRDEPMEIFEVGAEGLAPLAPPPDGEKAKRAIRPGEEVTLGWRPAIGLEIPGRPGWRLVALLGRGGFGEVWTGEHAKLRQRRAFKFCFDDERLRALKREVTLVRLLRTALGDRDDIVRFHELKLDEPPFYLESDLAPHGNLLQWAEKQGGLAAIPLAQRIALVAHTATALAAAHSIGVLHKDIKPTNILIFDGPDGVRPRLVDFGIGTLADPAVLGQHGVTAAGFTRVTTMQSTGTPTYSPPEYVAGKPYTVQGDIYGLGVLLYQLITADTSRPIAPGWERDITDALLREDIAACVDGDPARRLSSAADLADRLFQLDQRRVAIAEKERLTREAAAHTEAEAAAVAARLRAARFRKLAGAFAVLALLAITGGLLAWLNQRKADAARAEVSNQKKEVERKNSEYRAMLVRAAGADRFTASENFRSARQPAAFAYLARACENDPRSPLAAEIAVAALQWWNCPPPKSLLIGHKRIASFARFNADGTRVVTTSVDHTAKIWDAATGVLLATLEGHEAKVRDAAFSPDDSRVVTASYDRTAKVWNATTGELLATLTGHKSEVICTEFSPDGKRIVTSSYDRTARLWDSVTGNQVAAMQGHQGIVWQAQFTHDGSRIVTCSDDGTARVWDAANGKMLVSFIGHRAAVSSVDVSADDARALTASFDKTARIWDMATGKVLATLEAHEAGLRSAKFSADGTRIATAAEDKTARIWDASTGKLLITLAGHTHVLWRAEFSPDGGRLLTGCDDGLARVWDAVDGRLLLTLAGHQVNIRTARFSRDGTRVLTAADDTVARVWDVASTASASAFATHEKALWHAEFSPDNTRVVTGSEDNTARIWNVDDGKLLNTLEGHAGPVRKAHFSKDGKRIVTASNDKTARVWNAFTGELLTKLVGHAQWVRDAQFSPDGSQIVTGSEDRNLRAVVWDAVSGAQVGVLQGHTAGVWSAQFGPDGSKILTASFDRTACLWDAKTFQPLITFRGHEGGITCAELSQDGRLVVTASYDKTARIWEAASGKLLATLEGHKGSLWSAHFSPDNAQIVTTSDEWIVRLWDTITGKSLNKFEGHLGTVTSAQFNANGTRLVTCSYDRTARIWETFPASVGPPPPWFPDFLHYIAKIRLTSGGELEALSAQDWLALQHGLQALLPPSTSDDTPYLRILRKYLRN